MNRRKKIFITGGHITPAVALIEELTQRGGWEIVFVGRSTAIEGAKHAAYERNIVESFGVAFLPITTGRLQRTLSLYTITSLCKVPIGLIQALYYIAKKKPEIVMSFGGYIALPIVIAASLFGIPVVTHEQTLVPGLANRIIARFAKKVCVTFAEARDFFPASKVVLTGLPMRQSMLNSDWVPPVSRNIRKRPFFYITGGSTGAVSVNALLFPLIAQWTKKYSVVHQTGKISLPKATSFRETISDAQKERYVVADYFDAPTHGWLLKHSQLVIGRSGANTVIELALFGTVALFIPLPWSAGDEQKMNAQWLAKHGGAIVLNQKGLRSQDIEQTVDKLIAEREVYSTRAKRFSALISTDGAVNVANELSALILS